MMPTKKCGRVHVTGETALQCQGWVGDTAWDYEARKAAKSNICMRSLQNTMILF